MIPLPQAAGLPFHDGISSSVDGGSGRGIIKFLWWNEPVISDTLRDLKKKLGKNLQEMYDKHGWVNIPDQPRDRTGRPNRWEDLEQRGRTSTTSRKEATRHGTSNRWHDSSVEDDRKLQDGAEKERGKLWDEAERESNRMWEEAEKEQKKGWDDAEKQDRRLRDEAERNERDRKV